MRWRRSLTTATHIGHGEHATGTQRAGERICERGEDFRYFGRAWLERNAGVTERDGDSAAHADQYSGGYSGLMREYGTDDVADGQYLELELQYSILTGGDAAQPDLVSDTHGYGDGCAEYRAEPGGQYPAAHGAGCGECAFSAFAEHGLYRPGVVYRLPHAGDAEADRHRFNGKRLVHDFRDGWLFKPGQAFQWRRIAVAGQRVYGGGGAVLVLRDCSGPV